MWTEFVDVKIQITDPSEVLKLEKQPQSIKENSHWALTAKSQFIKRYAHDRTKMVF